MTQEQQIAKFIRALIGAATAPCDDTTQQNVAVAKNWLRAIEAGQLVVAEKEKSE